ncbi:MAG: FGGY family carbohydrate kinase [Spirochaetaceae bacterium]|nr:FGGY family carbohydrate kinase [Spirochaetaceae bacterium]
MSLLGIDLGTIGCKALLFDNAGNRLAKSYREYSMVTGHGGIAELDSVSVMNDVRAVIREASASAGGDAIEAISVSSMGEAFVPVTKNREILGNSILGFDIRGNEYLGEIGNVISDKNLYAINGNPVGSNYALTKLIWTARENSEVYEKADHFMLWSGFVLYMLGGRPTCDYALANRTLLFDLENLIWNRDFGNSVGFDTAKMPELVATGTVVGEMDPAVATELGINGRPKLVAGSHDQCANALGCGVLDEGTAMYGMGTFHCIVVPFARRPGAEVMLPRGLNTEHHAVPGRYVTFIYNQGGILLKWFRDTFLVEKRDLRIVNGGINIYEDLMDEMPEGPSSVLVSPNFSVTGPPDFLEKVTGMISGLTLATTRGDIAKGILEAVAYYLKENVDNLPAELPLEGFRVVGGGSRSEAWVQLLADVFGRPFTRTAENEAGALGAAIIAGVGSGRFADFREGAEALVRFTDTFEPDSERHLAYDRNYRRYKEIQPRFGDFLAAHLTDCQ